MWVSCWTQAVSDWSPPAAPCSSQRLWQSLSKDPVDDPHRLMVWERQVVAEGWAGSLCGSMPTEVTHNMSCGDKVLRSTLPLELNVILLPDLKVARYCSSVSRLLDDSFCETLNKPPPVYSQENIAVAWVSFFNFIVFFLWNENKKTVRGPDWLRVLSLNRQRNKRLLWHHQWSDFKYRTDFASFFDGSNRNKKLTSWINAQLWESQSWSEGNIFFSSDVLLLVAAIEHLQITAAELRMRLDQTTATDVVWSIGT